MSTEDQEMLECYQKVKQYTETGEDRSYAWLGFRVANPTFPCEPSIDILASTLMKVEEYLGARLCLITCTEILCYGLGFGPLKLLVRGVDNANIQ